jgi:RNA polymerase sigma-70 factor (ECF subfamily)
VIPKVEAASSFEAELDYVYRTFRRLGAQPAEAEDLAQDVFVVAWRRWSEYKSDRPLRPWLAGIAHHIAQDHFRRHSRREVATEVIEQEDQAPGPEDQLSSARSRRLALRALAMLSEYHRSILIQHDLDGMAIREIADMLSLPFFTVAARLRRARLRFGDAVRQLQERGDKRLALLSAEAILDAERAVPALDPQRRARMQLHLPAQGLARPSVPASVGPLPLVPALVAVVALGTLLALLLFWRAREKTAAVPRAPSGASARSQPPRTLAPPRLMPGRLTAADSEPPSSGLARGLVAHWRFEDEPGSNVAVDSSGRGHTCLLHDLDPKAAWVAGRVGGGLDLGRTGWLECPLPEARADVHFDLSIAAWIKRERQRPFSALFTRQLPSGDEAHLFWFGLRDDLLTVWSWAWTIWTSRTLPSPEGWIHVAFVHASRETRLYINGVPVRHKNAQEPRGEGVVQSALTIGASRFRPDPLRVHHHFDGLIDEAIVYDRPLTDAEVATLAGQIKPVSGPGQ